MKILLAITAITGIGYLIAQLMMNAAHAIDAASKAL